MQGSENFCSTLAKADLDFDDKLPYLQDWRKTFFPHSREHIGGELNLLTNLFHIARHIAQNNGESPQFFSFEERSNHDLDRLAQDTIAQKMDLQAIDQKLWEEYDNPEQYWKVIYPDFDRFSASFDACKRRILEAMRKGENPATYRPPHTTPEFIPEPEPSQETKEKIRSRDNNRCVCCGCERDFELVIDHILPKYLGGNHAEDNLQTLCKICNQRKGIDVINFLSHNTPLSQQPSHFPDLELPVDFRYNNQWEQFISRSINFFYQCSAVKTISSKNQGKRI